METEQSLLIVDSPFQALCALEAIAHYNVQKPHFVVFNNDASKNKILPIIQGYGEIHFINHQSSGTKSLIQETKQVINKKYSMIVLGDYFSYAQYVVAICVAKYRASFIYLDDGNSTVSIAPPIHRKRGWSDNEKRAYVFLDGLLLLKRIKRLFFTIYDFQNNFPYPTDKNSFSNLKSSIRKTKVGVYIIGTNSTSQKYKSAKYEDYLTKLAVYVQKRYPHSPVYYCPHRRDSNDYSQLIKKLNWKMFNTELSVEIDFVRKGISPQYIVGFGSTALFTLKNIFPEAEVNTVVVNLDSDERNRRYRNIEKYYSENGINRLFLEELE